MNKIIGTIYFLVSLLWCILLVPLSLLAPLGKLYEGLIVDGRVIDGSTYLVGIIGFLFSCLLAYIVFKFGVSLLKSSINMYKGIGHEEIQKQRIKERVKEKLNKKRNEMVGTGVPPIR